MGIKYMPLGKDVGKNIKTLRAENQPGRTKRGTSGGKPRPEKQILAIALEEARRHGNPKVKPHPGSRQSRKPIGGKRTPKAKKPVYT